MKEVPTGATLSLTQQEAELVRLHQSTVRDTLTIGTLLIAMRSKQPRGDWTAYLDGVAERTDISRRSLFRYIAAIEKPAKEEKAPLPDFRKALSPDGWTMGVLQSWLQKAIRRGDEEEARYTMEQFSMTGFDGAVWNICHTCGSEDIGLAERGVVGELLALHATYKLEKARKSEHNPQRLQLTHAVLLCVRAKKSRLIDHALICTFEGPHKKRTPPSWVFDVHTAEGRKAGKTMEDFFNDENPALNPKGDIEDQYAEEAKSIRTKAAQPDKKSGFGKATPTPSQITDLIFLGSNQHAEELDASFGTCLSVGSSTPRHRLGTIDYLHVPLLDNGPVTASDFSTCIDFIQTHMDRGNKILVHCNAGRNRSAAIVTGLLIYTGKFSDWDEAFAYVKSKRECIGCNSKVKESVLAALANGGET